MSLINPKPRFGYDADADAVYDYLTQRDEPLRDFYSAPDGVWDLFEVKRLILAGSTVEAARVAGPEQLSEPPTAPPEETVAPPAMPAPAAESSPAPVPKVPLAGLLLP